MVLFKALLLYGAAAQQIPGIDDFKQGGIIDNFNKAIKPLQDSLEPHKVH